MAMHDRYDRRKKMTELRAQLNSRIAPRPPNKPRDGAGSTTASEAPAPRRAPRGGGAARGKPGNKPRRRRSTMMVRAEDAGMLELYSSLKSLRWARVFSSLSQFWLLCYPGVSVKLMRCV